MPAFFLYSCNLIKSSLLDEPELIEFPPEITLLDDDESSVGENQESVGIESPVVNSMSSVPSDKEGAVGHLDQKEEEAITKFFQDGCGCIEKCSSYFDEEMVRMMRNDCTELSRNELDLYILGQLTCTTFDSCDVRLGSRHRPQHRKRPGATYLHKGRKVCCTCMFN